MFRRSLPLVRFWKVFFDVQRVFEYSISWLIDDLEYEFITKPETLLKLIRTDHCIFYLSTEEVLREKKTEVIFVDLSDDKYVDEIIG